MTTLKRAAALGASVVSKKPRSITDFFGPQKTIKTVSSVSKAPQSQKPPQEPLQEPPQNSHNSQNFSQKPQNPKISDDSDLVSDPDYSRFCAQHNFNKDEWVALLSDEQKSLLALEISNLHVSWLAFLHKTITQPYFLNLKRFLAKQVGKTIFPPSSQVYSWSHYTPLPSVKCIIMGQDPYHNHNQAHGLAFSVLEPTRPPPLLVNIYKALKLDFPSFEVPDYKTLARAGKPGGGNLTKWAKNGVLMLNAVLTVESHKANSHAGQGWEKFTEEVLRVAIEYCAKTPESGIAIMAWGSPAQKRVLVFQKQLADPSKYIVIKSVHPSPLSASRGWFDLHVFRQCNEWMGAHGYKKVDWGVVEGNVVQ